MLLKAKSGLFFCRSSYEAIISFAFPNDTQSAGGFFLLEKMLTSALFSATRDLTIVWSSPEECSLASIAVSVVRLWLEPRPIERTVDTFNRGFLAPGLGIALIAGFALSLGASTSFFIGFVMLISSSKRLKLLSESALATVVTVGSGTGTLSSSRTISLTLFISLTEIRAPPQSHGSAFTSSGVILQSLSPLFCNLMTCLIILSRLQKPNLAYHM